VSGRDLQEGQVIPPTMNYEVAPALAAAVAQAAMDTGWLAYTLIRTSSNAPVVISSMKES